MISREEVAKRVWLAGVQLSSVKGQRYPVTLLRTSTTLRKGGSIGLASVVGETISREEVAKRVWLAGVQLSSVKGQRNPVTLLRTSTTLQKGGSIGLASVVG